MEARRDDMVNEAMPEMYRIKRNISSKEKVIFFRKSGINYNTPNFTDNVNEITDNNLNEVKLKIKSSLYNKNGNNRYRH